MTFSTRNSYYLRISRDTVLVLYLYLDQAHVRWMTDYILQKVLADLRTRIGPKLELESGMTSNVGAAGSSSSSSSKKAGPTIDVHQGDDYQFCFFLRKTDHRHVVLLKHKRFVSRPIPPPPDFGFDDDEGTPAPRKSKKKGKSRKGKERDRVGSSRASSVSSSASGSGRKRRRAVGSDEDEEEGSEMGEDGRSERGETMEFEEEEAIEESVGPSRLRGGAGEGEEGGDEEMEDVDAAPSPPPFTFNNLNASVVKADPDDPSLPDAHDLLASPSTTAMDQDDDDEEAPLVALEFPNEEQEDQKPFIPDAGPFGGLGGAEGDDEKLFKPAMELTYTGFSIYEKQLCIVVEPWPALPPSPHPSLRRAFSNSTASPSPSPIGDRPPAQSRSGSVSSNYHSNTPGPSSSSRRSGSTSIPPNPSSSYNNQRGGGTPLFRPATPGFEDHDGPEQERERQREREEWEDWRGRSVSVVPTAGGGSTREGTEEEDEEVGFGRAGAGGGMMGLSQGIFGSSQAMGRGEGRVGEGEEAEDGDGGEGEGGGEGGD